MYFNFAGNNLYLVELVSTSLSNGMNEKEWKGKWERTFFKEKSQVSQGSWNCLSFLLLPSMTNSKSWLTMKLPSGKSLLLIKKKFSFPFDLRLKRMIKDDEKNIRVHIYNEGRWLRLQSASKIIIILLCKLSALLRLQKFDSYHYGNKRKSTFNRKWKISSVSFIIKWIWNEKSCTL